MSDLQTVVMQMPRMAGTPATYTSQVSEGGVKQMTSCCRITPQIAIMAARVTVNVSVISISIIGVTRLELEMNLSLRSKFYHQGVSTVVQGVMEEVVNQLYATCSATGREGGIASAHTKKDSVEVELHRLAVLPKTNQFIDIDRDGGETGTIGLYEARTTPRFGDRRA